jgi:hypothetical protein
MAPQYRNSAETFSLLATIYMDNPTTKLNSTLIKIILPPEQSVACTNQMDFYKIGGGSRPSFAIDNLSIINEATPLVNDTDYPKISNILSNDFDFLTKKTGKTYFVLLPSASSKPSS